MTQLTPDSIDQIAMLFTEASYPQNIDKFFDKETATQIKQRYAQLDSEKAYYCAKNSGDDEELLEMARIALAQKDALKAYSIAHHQEDEELKQQTRGKILESFKGNLDKADYLRKEILIHHYTE